MTDARTPLEKLLWNAIGEPLYYCEECLRCVHVKLEGDEVVVKRNCEHASARIMAPRKSYLSGAGYAGLSPINKIRSSYRQMAALLTGRNV